jgi:hypothetical protein
MADAIVFASFGPPQLWEETRKEYFKQHKSPFIRHVMKSVAQEVRGTHAQTQSDSLIVWTECCG